MSFQATDIASDLAKRVAQATEHSILEQLNDFVSRGLIEIQTTGPTFVQVEDITRPTHRIEVRQTVRLVLKDKDYIVQLEKENAKLKEILGFKNEMESLRR